MRPVQRRARGGRAAARWAAAAFHQDGADRHGENAAAGCQDDKVVDHAFVPMRGPEAGGWPRSGFGDLLPFILT